MSRRFLAALARFVALVAILAAFVSARHILAQQASDIRPSPDGIWRAPAPGTLGGSPRRVEITGRFAIVDLNRQALDGQLARAPLETSAARTLPDVVITIPRPDGSFGRFRIEESPLLAPSLAAAFPDIRTYRGVGLDDPTATARIDWTSEGFHAIVLSSAGTVYVDPYAPGNLVTYIAYDTAAFQKAGATFRCLVDGDPGGVALRFVNEFPISNGTVKRTYRLALAATGEYTAAAGGTKAAALARMTTTMNRVNGIYERELAVTMTMATGTDADPTALIYTDGTSDPYTNNDGVAMLSQNQANVDAVVGSGNYDVGHVFSTGGGGVASLRVPCATGSKARGVTGLPNPVGDAFDVDFVAHEMGHQFGANHPFNGTASNCGFGNRAPDHAFEVGSGSTIMSYAGICSAENLQPHSDDYFHVESLNEITAFLTSGGGASCGTAAATGDNVPAVAAPGNFAIPMATPFALTAGGSDADGDALTFDWEEYDLGTASSSAETASTDDGSRPILRSLAPTSSPTRMFPRLTYILNNANVPPQTFTGGCPGPCLTGEVLPSTSRAMAFLVTARDNHGGGGAIATAVSQVTVTAAAGPFAVTFPNSAVTLAGNTGQTVTWSVAGTNAAPVSTTSVRISLSTDGGLTFPTVLAANAPNAGSANVTIPNTPTSTARIKVEAVGNIYFDISNTNFTIGAAAPVLTVSRAGSGSGLVTSSPPGVSCGSDCSESYAVNTVVTLTATPDSDSTFAGWSGACTGTGTCQVTMSANRAVTATFTSTPSVNDRIAIGLYPFSSVGGWLATRKGSDGGYAAGPWTRLPWTEYDQTGGGLHPATGDVDGDGLDEVVVGLNSGGQGWLAVFDDEAHGYALLKWILVAWPQYDAANGETWPAVGDIDGDGRAEIVAGLGQGGQGYFQIFDDAANNFASVGFRQVAWAAYVAGPNGSTHPAIANVDGTGTREIVLGLGQGSGGWIEIYSGSDGLFSHQSWFQVGWPPYDSANGTTFPAAGDVDGDGRAEIVIGLGSGSGGWLEIVDDATATFAHLFWLRTSWDDYNLFSSGETHPAVGNVDDDSRAEIVIGLAPYSNNGGWVEIRDDTAGGYANLAWRNTEWTSYQVSGGGTFPAVGRLK